MCRGNKGKAVKKLPRITLVMQSVSLKNVEKEILQFSGVKSNRDYRKVILILTF